MIENFLNKRYSLRNLSDKEFNKLVPVLAAELEDVSYLIHYSSNELLKDWNSLKDFKSENIYNINSTSRVGMKLLEHFNQNIWNVKGVNSDSFADSWNKKTLEKVLIWNRKSHSTPYMSEIRRGVYFCEGLGKVTMYRPTLAKMICEYFKPEIVFDPCAGWGGRMLGSVAAGSKYIGVEPCKETYINLINMSKLLNIIDRVTLINDSAENFLPNKKVQLILTSPPYFNLEIYDGNDDNQSINKYPTYKLWKEGFLHNIIEKSASVLDGVSCWNVSNYGKYNIIGDVIKYHEDLGFTKKEEFFVSSSKRPIGGGQGRKDDITFCFRRIK